MPGSGVAVSCQAAHFAANRVRSGGIILFDFLGVRIGLEVSGGDDRAEGLCSLLRAAFRPHIVQAGASARDSGFSTGARDAEAPAEIDYSVNLGKNVRCCEDGQLLFETEGAAFPPIEGLLCESALSRLDRLVQIHAGVVSRRGACCLLPGPSGSGKSLLALALASRMLDCVADDVTLLDPTSIDVLSFYNAVRIKPNGFAIAEHHAPCRPLYTDDAVLYYTLTPPVGHRLMPRLIVFPVYRPTEKTVLRHLSGAEAAARIISNWVNVFAFGRTALDVAMSLVSRARCFALQVGDLDGAAEEVVGLMEGTE